MPATPVCVAAVLILAGTCIARPDFVYTGPAVDIPDSLQTGTPGAPASVTITITNPVTIAHLACSVYIPHTFQGDLVVTLTHVETGRTVTLIDRPYVPQSPLGFPASNYGTPAAYMALDDAAAAVYDVPAVPPPGITSVSGSWRPQSALAAFSTESVLGTWRLTATDYSAGDTGSLVGFKLSVTGVCYANCDDSHFPPIINANDFNCFLNAFAAGLAYANCDGSTRAPILNANDFNCFLNAYAAGCSEP